MSSATTVAIFNVVRFLHKKTLFFLPLTVVVLLLSGFFELATVHQRPAEVDKTMVLYGDSWDRSQGMANDGESYFFSCKLGLIKTELDCTTVIKTNYDAIPAELAEEYGLKHIGGISCYNGKLYCALEDSKVFKHPVIAVYDAETLEYTGEYHHLDTEKHPMGLPWVCVDPDSGIIYTAKRDYPTELIRYDIVNDEYLEPIPFKNPDPDYNIHKIQGGEVYNGVLYLATNDETQALYTVDLADGTADKLFDRNLFKGSEGEGLTILPTDDGAVIHAMDMSPIFASAYIRHYAMPQTN